MARSIQAEARERARAAQRRLAAERAERDKQIEDAAAKYFAGRLVIEEATEEIHAAVIELVDELGESKATVASLLGIETKELNVLHRSALKAAEKTAGSDGVPVTSGAPDE